MSFAERFRDVIDTHQLAFKAPLLLPIQEAKVLGWDEGYLIQQGSDIHIRQSATIGSIAVGPLSSVRDRVDSQGVRQPIRAIASPFLSVLPTLDLYFLQDLTGSFGDDIDTMRLLITELFDQSLSLLGRPLGFGKVRFGVGSFMEKPSVGIQGDYVYQHHVNLSPSRQKFQEIYDAFTIASGSGGDTPECQLEALMHVAYRSEMIGFGGGRHKKIVVILTDAIAHLPGEITINRPNDGDDTIDATEDYPSVEQVKTVLQKYKVIPIFLATQDAIVFYQGVCDQFGSGTVELLSQDSSNLISALKKALGKV